MVAVACVTSDTGRPGECAVGSRDDKGAAATPVKAMGGAPGACACGNSGIRIRSGKVNGD